MNINCSSEPHEVPRLWNGLVVGKGWNVLCKGHPQMVASPLQASCRIFLMLSNHTYQGIIYPVLFGRFLNLLSLLSWSLICTYGEDKMRL